MCLRKTGRAAVVKDPTPRRRCRPVPSASDKGRPSRDARSAPTGVAGVGRPGRDASARCVLDAHIDQLPHQFQVFVLPPRFAQLRAFAFADWLAVDRWLLDLILGHVPHRDVDARRLMHSSVTSSTSPDVPDVWAAQSFFFPALLPSGPHA